MSSAGSSVATDVRSTRSSDVEGHTGIWLIYALTALLGLVLAVERPAMQAILFQLVGPDLLPSAVAANSIINSMSRLVGPAMAGALIATVGVETCFAVNAASYLIVVAALVGSERTSSSACRSAARPGEVA
jgi:MFS family permease